MKELCDHQIDIDCKKVVFMYHQNQNVLSLKSDGLANQFLRFFFFLVFRNLRNTTRFLLYLRTLLKRIHVNISFIMVKNKNIKSI